MRFNEICPEDKPNHELLLNRFRKISKWKNKKIKEDDEEGDDNDEEEGDEFEDEDDEDRMGGG
jgi:hypothetical protein